MNIEQIEKLLLLQLDWIRAADSKVPSIFAINVAMLGLLAALVKILPEWTISAAIFCSITGIILSFSLIFLSLAMFPRLDGPKESNVFFGGIAKQSEGAFKENIRSFDESRYQDDVLSQVYRNAEIACIKYSHVKLAFISTFASILPWIVSIYLLYV